MTASTAFLTLWLREHGHVATSRELDELGIRATTRRRLVAAGRIVRVAHGLYIDGATRSTPEVLLRAYARGAGPGAAVSHRSAARLLGLVPHHPAELELTVPKRRQLSYPGATIHRADLRGEWVWRGGTPVTNATRTLLDLAALPEVGTPRLVAAIDQALRDGTTAVPNLVAIASPQPRRRSRGAPRLRHVLEDLGHLDLPDASALERHLGRLLRDLCRAHGIPQPVSELVVCGGRYRLDFAWPAILVAVEADGYAWHASPDQMGRDRWRRNELAQAGWTVLVFTWAQIRRHPEEVASQILAAYRRAQEKGQTSR